MLFTNDFYGVMSHLCLVYVVSQGDLGKLSCELGTELFITRIVFIRLCCV